MFHLEDDTQRAYLLLDSTLSGSLHTICSYGGYFAASKVTTEVTEEYHGDNGIGSKYVSTYYVPTRRTSGTLLGLLTFKEVLKHETQVLITSSGWDAFYKLYSGDTLRDAYYVSAISSSSGSTPEAEEKCKENTGQYKSIGDDICKAYSSSAALITGIGASIISKTPSGMAVGVGVGAFDLSVCSLALDIVVATFLDQCLEDAAIDEINWDALDSLDIEVGEVADEVEKLGPTGSDPLHECAEGTHVDMCLKGFEETSYYTSEGSLVIEDKAIYEFCCAPD